MARRGDRAWWTVALVICVLLPAGFPARAWAQGGTGQIEGAAHDEQGGVLPGVTLTLRNQASGVLRTTVTEADGRYLFPALQPGVYTLKAELQSFSAEEVTGIEITIGLGLIRDFTLKVQALQETVTVVGQPPVVDTTKSEVAGVVTQRQIETLPINSRQYLSLALLMPGTGLDATRSFFPTVNVGGSMTFNSTGNIVDGMINNFAEDGEPRQNLPQDAVQEFKVSNVQYKAEFGLATGGIVQVVTKSGTNLVKGGVFEYFRDKALNAKNVFETVKPKFRRHQFGGSAGGPIQKNRMHFFGAAERTTIDQFYTVNTGLPQFYSSVEGTFPQPFHRNLYFGRIDSQISNSQSWFARFAREDELSTCGDCGGTTASTAGFDQDTPRRSLVVGHTWVLGARQLNDFRFQYARAAYYIAPAGTTIFTKPGSFPPERLDRLSRGLNFPSLSYGSSFDELGPESRWQFKDTYASTFGRHEVKWGIDYSYMPYLEENTGNVLGSFTFADDQFFNPDDPVSVANLKGAETFFASIPPIQTKHPTKYYVGFVQDDWKIRPALTLNLGLRYERLYGSANEDLDPSIFPIPIPYIDVSKRGDKNNFGPRAGFAWDVRNDGTTVVRGGYGLYYGHVRILQNLNEFRNYQRFSINITNPSYPDPYQGRDPGEFIVSGPTNITVVANDYVQPYSNQFNLGFSHQLPAKLAVHVDAVYTQTKHDRKILDINPRDPVTGLRPNPTFGRVDRNQSTSEVRYRALYTKVEQRLRRTQFLLWLSKPAAAAAVTDAIVVSALAARGEVGYLDFGGHEGREGRPYWLPPRSRRRRWEIADRTAEPAFDGPEDGLERGLDYLTRLRADLPSGSFVFLVSDFFAPPPVDAWLRALALRWDVVPVIVQDPVWEQTFPELRSVTVPFVEPGTDKIVTARLTAVDARSHRAAHETRLENLLAELRAIGLDPLVVGTDDRAAIDQEFLAWAELRRQARRRGR